MIGDNIRMIYAASSCYNQFYNISFAIGAPYTVLNSHPLLINTNKVFQSQVSFIDAYPGIYINKKIIPNFFR